MRVPIGHAGCRSLRVDREGPALVVSLDRADPDTRSPYHRALLAGLRVRSGDVLRPLDPRTDALAVPAGPLRVELGQLTVLALDAAGELLERHQLCPFEVRFLADNGFPHPAPPAAGPAGLRTDLHTHFAGCVSGPDLVALGAELGISYPHELLAEAGIQAQRAQRLDELGDELRRGLASRLSVPLDRRITFLEMERLYRLRAPITKHPAAFLPLCRRIARDYAAMGAAHVELSLFDIVQASRLEQAHRELPAIEEESGVALRFLVALSRHDDLEWDLDVLDRLRQVAASRYLAGVDFMGHETNSSHAFAPQLRAIADWAHRARPGLTIRVHAGENPAQPENVRVAAECVAGRDVRLRIGHGLYGVDDATLGLLRRQGAIVEFNLDSNLALNNLQGALEAPIGRYLDAGLGVVLGTDGYGLYQTTLQLEAQAARIAGLGSAQLERIRVQEAAHLEAQERHERATTVAPRQFVVPPNLPPRHWTPELGNLREAGRSGRLRALRERLFSLGVPLLDAAGARARLGAGPVISVAGAWRRSWDRIAPAMQSRVREELRRLIAGLPPGSVLVTGGTSWGVEGAVHELARPAGVPVLGALVEATPPGWIDRIDAACLVGVDLHAKAAGLYELMREVDGLCLFVGGGPIVADEIQTAANLRLRYLVMEGVEGASGEHAARRPSRAFGSADEVLARLQPRAWSVRLDPFWHIGVNPMVDVVVVRTIGEPEVLLVRRHVDAACEPGRWALPGGFQLTDAPRAAAWAPGRETAREAAVRELREETGLDVGPDRLLDVGEYQGEGRDPRDGPTAWSCSRAFVVALPAELASAPVGGGGDTSEARYLPVAALPRLAFDHDRIVADALARLTNAGTPSAS
jgi:ADP-ribose pyrophosphatase YjhB (NUDIX family)/adenosine deaminase